MCKKTCFSRKNITSFVRNHKLCIICPKFVKKSPKRMYTFFRMFWIHTHTFWKMFIGWWIFFALRFFMRFVNVKWKFQYFYCVHFFCSNSKNEIQKKKKSPTNNFFFQFIDKREEKMLLNGSFTMTWKKKSLIFFLMLLERNAFPIQNLTRSCDMYECDV